MCWYCDDGNDDIKVEKDKEEEEDVGGSGREGDSGEESDVGGGNDVDGGEANVDIGRYAQSNYMDSRFRCIHAHNSLYHRNDGVEYFNK